MRELVSYSKYKNSKIPFLKYTPYEWKETPFNAIAYLKSIIHNENEELLSVYLNKGVIKYSSSTGLQVHKPSQDLSKYQLVEPGDLVLNNQQAWRGSVGVSNHRGIVSPAYYVFKLSSLLNSNYANYLLRNSVAVNQFVLSSKGIGSIQRNLYFHYLKKIRLPIPSLQEQNQIVKYLDYQLAKINTFIKSKKKLIELLKEQKQAVINEAVTKGINSDIKYKSADISFLEKIPYNWSSMPLKRVTSTKMTDGPHETPVFIDRGVPFISAEAVYDGKIDLSKLRGYISEQDHEKYCSKLKPQKNDIFIVKSGSTTGKCCILDFEHEFSVWSPLALVRSNDRNDPYFIFYAVSATYFQEQVQDKWSFGTQPNIGMGILQNLSIAVPPLAEQKEIATFIKKEIARIEKAKNNVEKEIHLITEYRTRLISDVVTGKVDVRHIEIDDVPIDDDLELDSEEVDSDELELQEEADE